MFWVIGWRDIYDPKNERAETYILLCRCREMVLDTHELRVCDLCVDFLWKEERFAMQSMMS